jgi:hypothetical protein
VQIIKLILLTGRRTDRAVTRLILSHGASGETVAGYIIAGFARVPPFATRRPAANEMISAGICEASPSPTDSFVKTSDAL